MREDWKNAAVNSYNADFYKIWSKCFYELSGDDFNDSVWLVGPSSYILHLGNARIGIDLQIRTRDARESVYGRIKNDLSKLDAVMVSHAHSDHLDFELLREATGLPVTLYLPDFLDKNKIYATGLTDKQIVWIGYGDKFRVGDVSVTSVKSPHTLPEDGDFPESGYLLEKAGKRIFFPVDVRDYNTDFFKNIGKVDTLFLHVWLGNENALNLPCEPYTRDLASLVASFEPDTVYCAHLYDFTRKLSQMWTYTHSGLVHDSIAALLPECGVISPRLGRAYPL